MSDSLIGVLIGGLIGALIPLLNLHYEDKKWRRQSKLEWLKSEKIRLEEVYRDITGRILIALPNKEYPLDLLSDISAFLPEAARTKFFDYLEQRTKEPMDMKVLYLEISIELKREIAETENKIKDMFK